MKLTAEQRVEILFILNDMYLNCLAQKEKLKNISDIWDDVLESAYENTQKYILNLMDKIKTDKDFAFSEDFWRSALMFEMVNQQDEEDLQQFILKTSGGFNGGNSANNNLS